MTVSALTERPTKLETKRQPAGAGMLVVLDPGVTDPDMLSAGVLPGAQVLRLDPHQDAIAQITAVAQQTQFTSIHLVAHGSPGALHFSAGDLNLSILERYSAALEGWFADAVGAELVLYGCHSGAGAEGAALVARLATLTGATVTASSQTVGRGQWPVTEVLAFAPAVLTSYTGQFNPSVVDIQAGASGSGTSYMTVFNDKLYFSAFDVTSGRELWVYDGTNPPSRVADIRAGAAGSSSSDLTVFNNKLYFAADDGINGRELWVFEDTGTIAPAAATAEALEVKGLGSSNTLTVALDQLKIDNLSELKIFTTDANGNNPTLVDSFTLLQRGQLPDAYSPTFSLETVTEGQFLQFQLVSGGVTRTATLSTISGNQALLTFDDGTTLTASLGNRSATTDLLTGDADGIDLTGQTGSVKVNFAVYREAAYSNTVGFYTTEDAAGMVKDPVTGNLLTPGDAGYKAAALANQIGPNLTGTNGQITTFSANITGGQHLATFLIANGSNASTGTVYFSHAGANNGNDYVKQLGNNVFGFEDMPGLGDGDYDDVVVAFAVA